MSFLALSAARSGSFIELGKTLLAAAGLYEATRVPVATDAAASLVGPQTPEAAFQAEMARRIALRDSSAANGAVPQFWKPLAVRARTDGARAMHIKHMLAFDGSARHAVGAMFPVLTSPIIVSGLNVAVDPVSASSTRPTPAAVSSAFEVTPKFGRDGIARLRTTVSAPAVREAIAAGDAPTLVTASTVVFEKQQAVRADLVAQNVAVAETASQVEVAGLQALVTNPYNNTTSLLDSSRLVSGLSAADQAKLTATLKAAGLGAQFTYMAEDLAGYMTGYIEAAKAAGVEQRLINELSARAERLKYLQGNLPESNFGAKFALNFFQLSSAEVARITANAKPAERAHIESQISLMNALGVMALQPYLSPIAVRDAAFLILEGFVGLNGQVDREPTTVDARFQGSKGTGSVAAVGSAPKSGDDGQKGSNQSWN